MKILITGATGFIGKHLVQRCLKEGHEVVALTRKARPDADGRIRWITMDEGWQERVGDTLPQVLIHAAWGGVDAQGRALRDVQQQNVRMTREIMEAAPYEQIIMLGSQDEYGYIDKAVDETKEAAPLSEYAKAKVMCQQSLQQYASEHQIEWQWVRVFCIYGEGQGAGWLIPAVTAKCLSGEKEMDTTRGEQLYSYLHVADLAKAVVSMVGSKGKSGVYNLSSHHPIRLCDLFGKIKELTGSSIRFNTVLPYRENQSMMILGKSDKFIEAFGEYERISLTEGLRRMIIEKMNSLDLAKEIRKESVKMVYRAHASHIGGAMSMADILAVLYTDVLRYDAENPRWEDRDRLLLSKGHACVSLYAVLALKGFYPMENLQTYAAEGSKLLCHISHHVDGVEISAGSLGHGLPYGAGLALAAKKREKKWRTYVILGDGEMDEGSNWEALLFAAHHRLDNLCVIIDYNKIQSFGSVEEVMGLEPLEGKLRNFGCQVLSIDGHNHEELLRAFTRFEMEKGRPTVIIANTVKGKGVSYMENNLAWHYKSPTEEQLEQALKEIEQ